MKYQLTNIMSDARVVLCHDSGIMHLASYLKTSTIALYGPTDISRTLPKSSYVTPIISYNETTYIMYDSYISEDDLSQLYPQYYCMSSITPDQVFDILKSYI